MQCASSTATRLGPQRPDLGQPVRVGELLGRDEQELGRPGAQRLERLGPLLAGVSAELTRTAASAGRRGR
jgi:hypothetical protein